MPWTALRMDYAGYCNEWFFELLSKVMFGARAYRQFRTDSSGPFPLWGSLALTTSLMETCELDELGLFCSGVAGPVVSSMGLDRLGQFVIENRESITHLRHAMERERDLSGFGH